MFSLSPEPDDTPPPPHSKYLKMDDGARLLSESRQKATGDKEENTHTLFQKRKNTVKITRCTLIKLNQCIQIKMALMVSCG